MDNLIADSIRWRIHKRNAEWMMYKTSVTDLITSAPAGIVAEYCLGTVAAIPEIAADKCIRGVVVGYKKHMLNIHKHDGYSHIVKFKYTRICKSHDKKSEIYKFGWVEFIDLIMTGYDEWICNEMVELIKDVDSCDDNKYIQCCINGDSNELAKKLIANLRSSIVGQKR